MINDTKKRKRLCPHMWGRHLITHAGIYVAGVSAHAL